METYETDHTVFTREQNEADKALLVRFFTKSVQDNARSAQEGRPIFRDKEYIEIRFPGNRTDAVARPATSKDKQRFPAHYKAFKERVAMPEVGTPLGEWPVISRSQAEELAFYNVKTVEQLASVSDSQGQKFMGFNGLRQKAKEFLELSKGVVEASQLRDELKQRDEVIQGLQKQMDDLIRAQKSDIDTSAKQSTDAMIKPAEADPTRAKKSASQDDNHRGNEEEEEDLKPRRRRRPLKRSDSSEASV